jgi:hypothetical protein
MPVRLAPSVYVAYRKYLLDLFPKSREIVALLLKPYNSLCNPYIPTESGLIDDPDKSNLLVRVTT